MFIKLRGILGYRLIVNVNMIHAVQEITEESKYSEFLEHGAKCMLQIDDKVIPIKDSIVQVENMLKKHGNVGGTS